ncbi:putative metallophosphoesterase [compost metagenome]
MKVLYDESITIADKFTLIGRKDKSDSDRVQLTDLMKGVDPTRPLFLLDHQPYELGVAADQGIDVMVSGHTHRGQIAPAHLITRMLYENDWGYLLKGNMHSIVTSGYGFWGPPIRFGSRSEIVQIVVSFRG